MWDYDDDDFVSAPPSKLEHWLSIAVGVVILATAVWLAL